MRHKQVKRLGTMAILAAMLVSINTFAQVVSYPGQGCYANDAGNAVCYCYGIPACAPSAPNYSCDWFGTKVDVFCVCFDGSFNLFPFDECGTTPH